MWPEYKNGASPLKIGKVLRFIMSLIIRFFYSPWEQAV